MRPCLVLIPGTLCDQRLFAAQARALRAHARVVRRDYRGVRRMAQGAEALARGLPARFFVAGFSLGGLWALELLRRMPERVQGLALIASNAEAASRRGRRRSAALWRRWHGQGPAAVARGLKPHYFHGERHRRRHARLVRDMALATPRPVARAQFEWAASRPGGLELLAAGRQPLLIISGAQDRLCPRQQQRRMVQARPDATWQELPRCGHFVPLEAPATTSRLLLRWLQRAATDPTGAPS